MVIKNSIYTTPAIIEINMITSEGILAASDIFKEFEGDGDFEDTPEIPGLWDK